MNDTRKRGLWRLNIALPERIEAALFNPRLDKLTAEPFPYTDAFNALNTYGATAEAALSRPRLDKLTVEPPSLCECRDNNTQGPCDGCGQAGKEYPEAWIA